MKKKERKITHKMDFGVTDEQAGAAMDALNKILEDRGQSTGAVILGGRDLSDDQITPLVINDTLHKITGRWYYVGDTKTKAWKDPSAWHAAYWYFVADYLKERFGKDWCLSSEQSLLFNAADGRIPRQLAIRTPQADTHVVDLPWGYELLVVHSDLPEKVEYERRFGLRLYPLETAILAVSPGFYQMNPMEARTCLGLLPGRKGIAEAAIAGGYHIGAGRLVGGLISVGNELLAEAILSSLRNSCFDVNVCDPFLGSVKIGPDSCAIATRIRLMWMRMRPAVISEMPDDFLRTSWSPSKVKERMDDVFQDDAAASLAMEGYDVKENLIRAVAGGEWEYGTLCKEAEETDVAVTIGYHEAFRQVQTDILDSMTGGRGPEHLHHRILDWHERLMKPLEQHGLNDGEIPHDYRQCEGFIRGSEHIPVWWINVPFAMMALSGLLIQEDNAFVRAVLGLFFIDYIRPVRTGSGLFARLYMNSQLLAGGYPWTVIPANEARAFEEALEKARVTGEIGDLARKIAWHSLNSFVAPKLNGEDPEQD